MAGTSGSTDYLYQLMDGLKNLDVGKIDAFIDLLDEARRNRKNVFVLGNGGSAATASHFVGDLNKEASRDKSPRFRAASLSDNLPGMMAYANDISYESIFVETLKNFMEPGDLVIGISGSGNSPNVLRSIEYANEHGGITIGLTGFSGGRLKQMVRYLVHVNIHDMQRVEDVHLVITHMAVQMLRQRQ
jgi:D-sedoheptulose 7-phosphate isomerase